VLRLQEGQWAGAKSLLSRALLFLIFARFTLRGWVRVNWNTVSDAIDQGSYLQLGLFMREGRALSDGNRSPLYPALLSLFARREWAYFTEAKILSLLLGLASLAIIYYLARRMFSASVALATILLLSVNDNFQMEASWVRCEILLIPLFFAVWYLVAEGFRDRHLWLWAGLLAGLCQLTKGNGHLLTAAFLLGGLLTLGWSFLKDRMVYAFILAYLITISPLLAINTVSYGDPFYNYNTSHALWLDRWEDTYIVSAPPPTMSTYLQSHSLREMWQRQRYGMRRAVFDGARALFPFFFDERESRAVAVGIGGLLACVAVLLSWRYIPRDGEHRLRFRGTLAFSAVLLLIFYLLFAWYAQVISKPRFYAPLIAVVYAGGLGVVGSLSRVQRASQRVLQWAGRALHVLGELALIGWLLHSMLVTVFAVGQVVHQLRDPYAVDLEAGMPREDMLKWLAAWATPGEPVLWGPSHYLPRWKYTPHVEFIPIPIDLGSWEELTAYVHQRGIRYWVLDSSTIRRREDLLGGYFDHHLERIVFRQLPPRWELVHADRKFVYDYCIFRAYPDEHGSPPMSRLSEMGVGSHIQLLGFNASVEDAPSGRGLDLTLHWSAREGIEHNYKVFTHLLSPDGTVHSQHDDQPLYGLWPTRAWEPGQRVVDHHHLLIDDEAPPGVYRIEVGLYDGETMERLSVTDMATGVVLGDHVVLPTAVHIGSGLG